MQIPYGEKIVQINQSIRNPNCLNLPLFFDKYMISMGCLVHLVIHFVYSNNIMRVNANSAAPLVYEKLQTSN